MEVWLTGTPAELDAAIAALTAAAYVTFTSEQHPMAGVDTGRYRAYLRLAVTTAPAPRRPAPTPAQGGALIDLDTARTARRPTSWKEKPGA